jgi:hypothetical protein
VIARPWQIGARSADEAVSEARRGRRYVGVLPRVGRGALHRVEDFAENRSDDARVGVGEVSGKQAQVRGKRVDIGPPAAPASERACADRQPIASRRQRSAGTL